MSAKNKITTLEELGEFGLIERITKKIKQYHESTILGPKDDAALISHKNKTLVSADLLIEGIHFVFTYHFYMGNMTVAGNGNSILHQFIFHQSSNQTYQNFITSGQFLS